MFNFRAAMLVLLTFLTAGVNYSQPKNSLSRWLNIKPFIHRQPDVEKLFGRGNFNQNKYFITYKTNDFRVSVGYSSGSCGEQYADWNLPEWTVTDVSYKFFENPPKLKDLIDDRRRFAVSQVGDGIHQIQYYDASRGIKILWDNYKKAVEYIVIVPSKQLERKHKCR